MSTAKERLAEALYDCVQLGNNIDKLLSTSVGENGTSLVERYRNRVLNALCRVYTEAEVASAINCYSSNQGASYQRKALVLGEEIRVIINDLIKSSHRRLDKE